MEHSRIETTSRAARSELCPPNASATGAGRKVAILQSNYIPWKGYFDLINLADEFILLDEAQYSKGDWRNRNKVKTAHGLLWLTIPVHLKGKGFPRIQDTVVSDPNWNRKHWKTIAQHYARAKYFPRYRELFEELYWSSNQTHLSKINHCFLSAICDILGINTKISWSIDYRLVDGKTERLVDLCKQTGATEYISGPAAKAYINEDLFAQEGVTLRWMDYSGYPEYEQLFPPFEHKVSVIDLIFNEGPDASKYMKSF